MFPNCISVELGSKYKMNTQKFLENENYIKNDQLQSSENRISVRFKTKNFWNNRVCFLSEKFEINVPTIFKIKLFLSFLI